MKEIMIGKITEGVVSGIQPYGVFVQLDEAISGMIHISEISHGYVNDINDFVKIGDHLQVKIIGIDEESNQIRLSLKALTTNRARKERIKRQRKPLVMKIGFKTIEAMLPQWINETTKEINNDKI